MNDKNMLRVKKIHFIGVGGVGMSGIAEVLANLNYEVSGSDLSINPTTQRLSKLGIKVYNGHAAANVIGADVVVVSSAVQPDNIEIITANENRIPVIPRAEMLAELMRFNQGIAIAGTHGKTTTTSLIASILAKAGFDPTFVIGGQLNSLGKNANLGKGKYFVAEADESDASFLHLTPIIAVITNIDNDHLGTYDNDMQKLKNAFLEFINRLPFYGRAVICIDDPGIQDIYKSICKPAITYGFSEGADVQAFDWYQVGGVSTFKVRVLGKKDILNITLNLPGKHNVLNALASIAVALEVGVSVADIFAVLNNFQGIGRRFHILGNYHIQENSKAITLVDDYGHHPSEVAAVINAIRTGWPERRLVMVYQPHRYSRTKALFNDFVTILATVDILLILDVYSAGEAVIEDANSANLCKKIKFDHKVDAMHIIDKTKITETLQNILKAGDMLLMQGAGDIGKLAREVSANFETIYI